MIDPLYATKILAKFTDSSAALAAHLLTPADREVFVDFVCFVHRLGFDWYVTHDGNQIRFGIKENGSNAKPNLGRFEFKHHGMTFELNSRSQNYADYIDFNSSYIVDFPSGMRDVKIELMNRLVYSYETGSLNQVKARWPDEY